MKNGKVTIATKSFDNPVMVEVDCKVEFKGDLCIHRPLKQSDGRWVETNSYWNITAPNGFQILRTSKIYTARFKASELLALNINWTDKDSLNFYEKLKPEIVSIRD
jgi:hypothetical protein